MSEQVHNRLADERVRMILWKYVVNELTAAQAMELPGLKQHQFFEWVQGFRGNQEDFNVDRRQRF
jgi:hypothetical protein